MKLYHFFNFIAAVSIILTGCVQTKITTESKSQSIYQQGGVAYENKYIYSDSSLTLKIFDEKTKETEFLCRKKYCIHDKDDLTCVSYGRESRAFVATKEYLYIFVRGYQSPKPGHIDRINLADGSRTVYSDENDFFDIYNAYLYDGKVFFSDLLPAGGCAVKVFDIEKKTLEIIANEKESKDVFSWVNGIENDVLYFREDYHEIKIDIPDYDLTPYDYMGVPSWYNNFIASTSLFTYNLNTCKTINTAKNINQFGNTYYNKGFYFVDKDNNARKIDWTNGKNTLLFSSNDILIKSGEKVKFHQFCFDDKLGLTAFKEIKPKNRGGNISQIITKKLIYDIVLEDLQPYNIDEEIQFLTPLCEMNDGLIVSFNTKSQRRSERAYMSKSDYYGGKMNLIELE